MITEKNMLQNYLFGAGGKKRTSSQLEGLFQIRLPRTGYPPRFFHLDGNERREETEGVDNQEQAECFLLFIFLLKKFIKLF